MTLREQSGSGNLRKALKSAGENEALSSSGICFLPMSFSGSVVAGEAKPPAMDGRGRVLCQWTLAVAMRATLTTCYKQLDRNYIATFDWAIHEIDTYILRNSSLSASALEDRKRQVMSQTVSEWKDSDQCAQTRRGDAAFPAGGMIDIAKYRDVIKQILAVDRPLAWNPCF